MNLDRALSELQLLDVDLHARLVADMATWRARPKPTGVVLGDYNVGKTSLLKRLCVEFGGTLPPEARVAGDPTTDTVGTTFFSKFCLLDTPGLFGGDGKHDERAIEAALTTDFLVLTVLPSLFTGKTEVIEGLLTGTTWGASPPPGLLVLTQSDRVGVSPIDDHDGWSRVCKTKRNELEKRLANWRVSGVDIALVSADPFGTVGDLEGATIEDYTAQDWDGIPALAALLDGLAAAGLSKRPRALVRHASRLARNRAAELRKEAETNATSAASLAAQDPAPAHTRIGAIVERERERLRTLVHGAADSLALRVRAGEAVGEPQFHELLDSLDDALLNWQATASAQLGGELDEDASFFAHVGDAAGWSGAGDDPGFHQWSRFAPQLEALMERVGKSMSDDPLAVREKVDKIYSWMDWKAKPWEKRKKTEGMVAVGKGVRDAAQHAAAALALVDGLRQWMTENQTVAAREQAERALRKSIDRVADEVFLGNEKEPGIGRWWQRYDTVVRSRHAEVCATLRDEAARLSGLADALDGWRAAVVDAD